MRGDLEKRVSALIYIRAIVVTILLGSFYLFEIGYEQSVQPISLSYLVAFLYFLTVVYALVLYRIKRGSQFAISGEKSKAGVLATFAYIQITIDIAAETGLVYMTGGIDSMFAFLFPLSILSAGIVLNRRACYVFATLSSILYGLLLDLQFYNLIKNSTTIVSSEKDYFYKIFAHITAFYMVGYLSGYLSEKLHKATRSLQESEMVLSDLKAFNEYIIESIPSGIFTTDLNERIISFNTAAQEITRLGIADVAGKKTSDIFPFLLNFLEPIERVDGELHHGGETFSIGMRLSKLRDGSGRPIGLIGVFQDLTALKIMEAEVKRKEKWAYIGELSASIAHELRNPLASLQGAVEMLREKKVPQEHADHLMEIALSEMDRLNGIITDFLLYARPRELTREPFDLHQSLRDIITLLNKAEPGREDIEISTKLDSSLFITGDPAQIRQVFWNLGLNALDAVSDGGSVEINTRQSNNSVEILFSDSGTGISKNDMDNIFYPFFTTKEKGTGLGLSIAQKIAEEHGGRIIVESGEGIRGTTFRVILPLNNARVEVTAS